jgi:hypothetical protein
LNFLLLVYLNYILMIKTILIDILEFVSSITLIQLFAICLYVFLQFIIFTGIFILVDKRLR